MLTYLPNVESIVQCRHDRCEVDAGRTVDMSTSPYPRQRRCLSNGRLLDIIHIQNKLYVGGVNRNVGGITTDAREITKDTSGTNRMQVPLFIR